MADAHLRIVPVPVDERDIAIGIARAGTKIPISEVEMLSCFIIKLEFVNQCFGQGITENFHPDKIIGRFSFKLFICAVFVDDYLVQTFVAVFPTLELGCTKLVSFLWSQRIHKQSIKAFWFLWDLNFSKIRIDPHPLPKILPIDKQI